MSPWCGSTIPQLWVMERIRACGQETSELQIGKMHGELMPVFRSAQERALQNLPPSKGPHARFDDWEVAELGYFCHNTFDRHSTDLKDISPHQVQNLPRVPYSHC